ncbi:siroheme synthase CysG [Zooshikella harenae]|uniref:Siroheme synthase n=1 Tax=Zooshikella harenae TaxID=2827238 RepID=A0ABS5ZDT7_9GAMM|nr:siroheme synthase CysG [Zooshikella harenae]MBU2712236.1 uroporphyrinogen-III C-methyltransferase [Zooshikella harenae]
MQYLPLFHQLQDQPCLIVGGGDVATRKARLLLQAGAQLTVIAPDCTVELHELLNQYQGTHLARRFLSDDIGVFRLVIACTNDTATNEQISQLAQQRSILVNVVDSPSLSTVIFPAIIDRSPLVIALTSGGTAPVLARLLRGKLETLIPAAYGKLAALAGRFRPQIKAAFPTVRQRRVFWEQFFSSNTAELVLAGKEQDAENQLQQQLQTINPDHFKQGEVYLVGGGPGDPDLLTFRALRLMQQADVVLYDRLVAPAILELTRRDAERIYVGKARSNHALPQAQINELLVSLAQEGKRVLRLKGGDPFIFGRGGEEIDRLAEAGIPFQVVPGITAASGCACYAGIPLTHRDYAQSVRFITGHRKYDKLDLDWQSLCVTNETLVFYMGLMGLAEICQQLIQHGRDPQTPIALVQQGTTEKQQVFTGTLMTMPDLIAQHTIKPPTLIIVGNVVKLHKQLSWYQPQPTITPK